MIYAHMRSLHIYTERNLFLQTGRIALWEAYEAYDETKGAFAPLASAQIRGRLLDELKRAKRWEREVCIEKDTFWEQQGGVTQPELFDQDVLLEYCRHLSTRQALWVTETILHDKSVTQIAKEQGVSPSAVKKWKKEAKASIKRMLEENQR